MNIAASNSGAAFTPEPESDGDWTFLQSPDQPELLDEDGDDWVMYDTDCDTNWKRVDEFEDDLSIDQWKSAGVLEREKQLGLAVALASKKAQQEARPTRQCSKRARFWSLMQIRFLGLANATRVTILVLLILGIASSAICFVSDYFVSTSRPIVVRRAAKSIAIAPIVHRARPTSSISSSSAKAVDDSHYVEVDTTLPRRAYRSY